MAFTLSNGVHRIVDRVAACLGLALVFSAPGQILLPAAAQTASPTPGAAAFPPVAYDESLRDLVH